MDPASIGASVIALLTPLAKETMQDFAGMAGDAAAAKAKELREWLRAKLSGDSYATETLERFEAEPETYGGPLQAMITQKVNEEPELADELTSKIEEIERTAPTIAVVQEMQKARNVIGAEIGEAHDVDISVKQKIGEAEDVTGVKIGKATAGETSRDEDDDQPSSPPSE